MKKIIKLIIISILSLILVILIILKIDQKEKYKTELTKNSINIKDSINDLIQEPIQNITKEIKIEFVDTKNKIINNNYIYNYKINLKSMYLSGTIQKNNEELVPIYLLKDNGKYYYYQDNDWIRENENTISYNNEFFINDYKQIIELLKNIESSTWKSKGTYKVKIKKDVLKKYIKQFSNKNDPSLSEELLIKSTKINLDNIYIYITITNNSVKEILFDFSKIFNKNATYYYSIYFNNKNKTDVKIPTNILANLF